MTLSPATRLGSYEILGALGAGGMGEVYRASDTKLKREVAIKVLPEAFARDEARMKRFEREAQLLASLNHPNIASIHGLEEANGVRALVMELVEGPTLAERMASGPIPVEESLRIAVSNRARTGGRARESGHPSRPEAREREAHERRGREDPRLRSRESARGRTASGRGEPLADVDASDAGGRSSGDGGVHEPGAGEGKACGSTGGRVGVRGRAVRDADREARVRGRRRLGDSRARLDERAGLSRSSAGVPGAVRALLDALPDEGS